MIWYQVLGSGIKIKYKTNKLEQPEQKTILRPTWVGFRKKMVKQTITSYPAFLKHFIIKCKVNPNFQPHRTKVRDEAIDILLNSKK